MGKRGETNRPVRWRDTTRKLSPPTHPPTPLYLLVCALAEVGVESLLARGVGTGVTLDVTVPRQLPCFKPLRSAQLFLGLSHLLVFHMVGVVRFTRRRRACVRFLVLERVKECSAGREYCWHLSMPHTTCCTCGRGFRATKHPRETSYHRYFSTTLGVDVPASSWKCKYTVTVAQNYIFPCT